MNVEYDLPQVNAMYITFGEGNVHTSDEIEPGVIADRDEGNRLVGLEVLALKNRRYGNR